jgi:suppressor of fused protein SUFU
MNMKYREFYESFFKNLEPTIGRIDPMSIMAIIGSDAGGPLNLCTIGADVAKGPITYLSSELAVRPQQRPSEFGRYELLVTCDDERWVRSILTYVGRMSMDVTFGHHHTLDIGPWVQPRDRIQGLFFEKAAATRIESRPYGVLRCIGVCRGELEFALERGVPELKSQLDASGIYPLTSICREPIV